MSSSRSLLLGTGMLAAMLFITVTLVEICVRPGFSIERHPISMLSLGPRGWLMVATFVICGILTMAFAVAFLMASGARVASGLLIAFGLCCVLEGFFPTQAAHGFPPGTSQSPVPDTDMISTLNAAVFMAAVAALILACLALAWHYWRQHAATLALGLLLIGLVMPVVVAMGLEGHVPRTVAFYSVDVLGWQVIALVAWQELSADTEPVSALTPPAA